MRFFSSRYRFKNLFSWIALLLTTCFLAIACSQSPDATNTTTSTSSPASSEEAIEISIATEDDYPPFDYLENGQHVGYNQDLLDYIVKEKSLKIKQEILPFQGILPGIASNKYTATNAAVGLTAERANAIDFTMPITELTHYILTRKGDTAVKSLKDLADKTVAVQQGGISAAVVQKKVEPELAKSGSKIGTIKEYGAFGEAYQDLQNKRVDAVVNNLVALTRLVNEKPDLYEIKEQVGPKVYAAWAVKKGNKEVLDILNDGLAKAKESGEMKKLQQQWLKVTFEDLPDAAPTPAV